MSYRNDASATYDSTLLSSVPDPTRAEKQEGYSVDLLEGGLNRRNRGAHTPPETVPTDQQPLTDDYSPGTVALAHKEGQLENGTKPAFANLPWYRTRWGMTAIVIAIVLIIGGVVGGVVGGTHHSSHKSHIGNNTIGSGPANTTNTNGTEGGSPSSSNTTINNGGTPNGSGSAAFTTTTTSGSATSTTTGTVGGNGTVQGSPAAPGGGVQPNSGNGGRRRNISTGGQS